MNHAAPFETTVIVPCVEAIVFDETPSIVPLYGVTVTFP